MRYLITLSLGLALASMGLGCAVDTTDGHGDYAPDEEALHAGARPIDDTALDGSLEGSLDGSLDSSLGEELAGESRRAVAAEDDGRGPDPTPWKLDGDAQGPDPTPWEEDDVVAGHDVSPWHGYDDDDEPDPQPWRARHTGNGTGNADD